MIVCEQTRLRVIVLVLSKSLKGKDCCVQHASKSTYVTASSNPGLCRIRCCMVFHRSEVMVLIRRALFFT